MYRFPTRGRRILCALAPVLALPAAVYAQCPSAEEVGKTIQQVFKRPIEVKKVTPSPLKEVCEVQVSFQGRANILYISASGSYFMTGHLIDTKSGKDLTEDSLSAINAFSPADMQKAASLAALSLGTKGKTVYFATDPQ
jgi:thiol:disulfide interchange protein DsbC